MPILLFRNRLYWKLSATFLLLLAVLGIVYLAVTGYMARNYFAEANQRLYGGLAEHLVQETSPNISGLPDTAALHDIMHSMMVINPSVEVYLLDTSGNIIDFVVPFNTVQLDRVDLKPVREFIRTKGSKHIVGDDPKSPGVSNVFSAAPIYEGESLTGYAYIILASKELNAVTTTLLDSYFLKSGTAIFLAALLGSLLIGLLAIWLITRNLRHIIAMVQRFKEGDIKARIRQAGSSDLASLATNINEMADTIMANMEQLKSVETLRRELIANVSHDLRTPLAILQGYVETLLLKDAQLDQADRKRYLEIVLNGAENLSRLISQLFEFSQLEAKQVHPQKQPFFIAELAQDIFQKFQILAQQKHIRLQLDMPPKLPLVFADLGLVEQVVQNLLDNALKFTPIGGVVTIALAEKDKHVEVRITDTGPGIPENMQAVIFERYQRATDAPPRSSKGAGLGLAIAKKILELHDATIRVQSRLNEGTAFMFQLPAYAR